MTKGAIQVFKLRCSGCNKSFIAVPPKDKQCPHCGQKYVFDRGTWRGVLEKRKR